MLELQNPVPFKWNQSVVKQQQPNTSIMSLVWLFILRRFERWKCSPRPCWGLQVLLSSRQYSRKLLLFHVSLYFCSQCDNMMIYVGLIICVHTCVRACISVCVHVRVWLLVHLGCVGERHLGSLLLPGGLSESLMESLAATGWSQNLFAESHLLTHCCS